MPEQEQNEDSQKNWQNKTGQWSDKYSSGRSIRQLDLDPLDFNFHASRPTYLEIVRRGIEESLDRLDRLSVAIRQSSEASRARRVQNYLESHLDPHFETLIDNILRCLWPSAECSLLKQLQKSIVFRRARILYQQDCQNRLQAERTPQDDFETLAVQAQNEGERKEDFEQHGGHSEGRMASATAIHTHEPKSRTTQSVMESKKPSTVDEDIFKNKYVENAPSKSGTSLVSVAWADGFPYPPPPKPSAGKNGAKCTICFRPYMEISFRNETWWKYVYSIPLVIIPKQVAQHWLMFAPDITSSKISSLTRASRRIAPHRRCISRATPAGLGIWRQSTGAIG